MSWLEMLALTYDNCLSEVGKMTVVTKKYGKKEEKETYVLLPIYHMTNNAALEVVLDITGEEVLDIMKVDKKEQITIMPATEDSAGRSSGIAPLPLCDKLTYLAGDYDVYVIPQKEKDRKRPRYDAYMAQLKKWAEQPETPAKVKAIYHYLSKGCLLHDLKEKGLFDGTDVFVRFSVVAEGDLCRQTWLDTAIHQSYIDYYRSTLTKTGLDYVTGQTGAITDKLPAKIRHAGDSAKLISSNDTTDYTFKGRFKTADEAVTIGYEVSQKAHNALRWLIARQGYRNDSEYIVCWSTGNQSVPDVMASPYAFMQEDDDAKEEHSTDTEEVFAKKLDKALAGYRQNFAQYDDRLKNGMLKVITMAVDTADGADQGRLSITYYNEQDPELFLHHIFHWYQGCSWRKYYQVLKEKGQFPFRMGSPSLREIVLTAYGTEQNGIMQAEKKLMKKTVDRLLPCIVQGQRIPTDIVRAAVKNVSDPRRFSSCWNTLLENVCAVIRKYQIDYGKEVFAVALNTETTDRDYLFGRLLSVMHHIEDYVNYKTDNKGRETNAMKYWSAYAQKPAYTTKQIRDGLQSYITKLNSSARNYYQLLLEDIFGKLEQTNAFTNVPLRENYLLGYYSQSAAFRTKDSANHEKEENEE